jgi:hypothetical protein
MELYRSRRLLREGNETVTNCNALKIESANNPVKVVE